MSRGLGARQRLFLDAIGKLEADHGIGHWFFTHAIIREAWPAAPGTPRARSPILRPVRDAEGALNPSRILAALARRGLVERNARHGPGASVRLTEAGRAIQ